MSTVNHRWSAVLLCGVATAFLAVGPGAAQSGAPKPPAPKVDEATEKKLAELTARADQLLEEGKFAEAGGPAREAAKLAAEAYGDKDWRAFDADRRLKLAETGKDLPEDKQKRLAEAFQAEAQGKRLEGSKPAEAEKLALRAGEGYAAVLGEQTLEQARAWHLVGRLRGTTDDAKGAKEANLKALEIRRKKLPAGHPDIARSLNNLGLTSRSLGELNEAAKNVQEAVDLWKATLGPGDPLVALGLGNLGNVQRDLRNYEGARKSHQKALDIYRKTLKPDDPRIADTLNNLGNAQRDMRNYEGARKSHQEALDIQRKALKPDDPRIADSLTNVGLVQWDLRDYEEAKKSHLEALDIYRTALKPNDPRIALSLNNLGILQRDLRDYEGAKKLHLEALDIYRKALKPNDPRIAGSLTSLGNVQQDLRDYEEARKSYQEALDIYRTALPKDQPHFANTLNNLGTLQHDLRDYEGAKMSYLEALDIRRTALTKDDPRIADSLNNLGAVQRDLRDYKGAMLSHLEALDIRRKALPKNHPDIATSLNNLGLCDLASGATTAKTTTNLVEALAIERSHILALAGSQAEAEQFRASAEARGTLSLYLSATLAPRAKTEASDVYDQVGWLKGLVTARQRWARELRDGADDNTRRLLDDLQKVNPQLLRAALGPDRLTRGRPAELARLEADRKDLERRLAARSEAFGQYQKKAGRGGAVVKAALPPECCLIDFLEYTHRGPPPKEKADPVFERRLLAFVVRPRDEPVRVVELGPADRIDQLVTAWREWYAVDRKPTREGEADPGAELRKLVWDPVEPHLGKPDVVLVSPDGPLNFLPFAALPGKKPGTFLVHEFAFAVAPAPVLLPDLLAQKPARPENPSLLLVGAVDFGEVAETPPPAGNLPTVPTNWPKLPGTGREVNDLQVQFQDAFPKAPAQVLKTDKATKEAFVDAATKRSYVHLATHGFFADEAEASVLDPSRRLAGFRLDRAVSGRHPGVLSGVVFAGVNRPPDGTLEDCLLTALEAAELDLRGVDLVTLSACDTGRGRTAGGEGVVGLQRAFQVGGARSVVASQWKVPDAPTQDLMSEFYKRLWDSKPLGKAKALQEAQLWMITEWKGNRGSTKPKDDGSPLPPYFWAAFTLSGDWR
jgi:CHAT domain-containing protein/tetratricopeptide (TPR) repeat protein